MPGHYPDRVCQHVHYRITAPGHKPLITQLYFATDPVFEGDPDRNFGKDPLSNPRAGAAGDDRGRPRLPEGRLTFDLVLERA